MPEIWWQFRTAIQNLPTIDVGRFVAAGCRRPVSEEVRAAYDAPVPRRLVLCGPPGDAGPGAHRRPTTRPRLPTDQRGRCWRPAKTPMLVAFGDSDPITGGMAPIFKREMRGAQGIDHPVIRDAGHFLQEDAGEELAGAVVEFLAGGPRPGCSSPYGQVTAMSNGMSTGAVGWLGSMPMPVPVTVHPCRRARPPPARPTGRTR